MSRNRLMGVLLALAAIALMGSTLGLILPAQKQVVAESRSPDGSWAVTVVGQKILFGLGGIEIDVEPRDGQGRILPGAYVDGMCGSWAEARRNFGAVSCGPTQAVVNGRTIQRKNYLGR